MPFLQLLSTGSGWSRWVLQIPLPPWVELVMNRSLLRLSPSASAYSGNYDKPPAGRRKRERGRDLSPNPTFVRPTQASPFVIMKAVLQWRESIHGLSKATTAAAGGD